jgi:hypothetical protein
VRPGPAPALRAEFAPTPLLAFLAGEHAEAIARVWPAPHGEFIALPAARRHMAALALTRLVAGDHAHARRLIEFAPARDVVSFAFRQPPRGLARALSRLGERLWPEAEYAALILALRDPDSAQVLAHAAAIDIALLAKLHALATPLRKPRIVALLPDANAAATLSEAFALTRRLNPRRPERDVVLAWSRAQDLPRLADAARAALTPDRFGEAAPAPAMPRPYRAIVSRAGLESEALRFRNCIASYAWDIGADQLAVYVYEGEPAAMIALKRDVGGWRLAEALGFENLPLPDEALSVIAADFALKGVRIGQPARAIEDRLAALSDTAAPRCAATETLAARYGLGQLWR